MHPSPLDECRRVFIHACCRCRYAEVNRSLSEELQEEGCALAANKQQLWLVEESLCHRIALRATRLSDMAAAIGGDDLAWWETIFINEGARAVEAQRRLTCYTDPYTGWVELFGVTHVVRQRSPWKTGMDLSALGRGVRR